jgi:predicted Fe-S protein YdhL (DUF1289 family)
MSTSGSQTDSPCVKNCCLDKTDVCIGCGRAVEEIIRWGDAGEAEKQQILQAAKQRKADRVRKFDEG